MTAGNNIMKKISTKSYLRTKRRLCLRRKHEYRKSGLRKHHKKIVSKLSSEYLFEQAEKHRRFGIRNSFIQNYYRRKKFDQKALHISLPKNFGIEDPNSINEFFEASNQFIDTKASKLVFDMKHCDRIWPSAVTLLCSMAAWVELVSVKPKVEPKIFSIVPDIPSVDSYLNHCGFNRYVRMQQHLCTNLHDISRTVPIKRETNNSNMENREDELSNLIRTYSSLSDDELEILDTIIMEIGLNVTEHGRQKPEDTGWWVLGQYHERHKLISICIADNGIGIRNSLLTGPQREAVIKQLENCPNDDGEFIKLAVSENVSGAMTASLKTKKAFIFSGWESGSRRGNGLKRITNSCSRLGITLTIMSNSGYFSQPGNGSSPIVRNFSQRIFAGTMYHLGINV